MSLNGLDTMVLELIVLSRLWTGGLTAVVEVQSKSMGTHPAHLTRWVAHHQCISRDGFGDHRSGADEGERSNVVPTDDGGIGSDGCAALNESFFVETSTNHLGPWIGDVGQHTGWPEEDIVFNGGAGDFLQSLSFLFGGDPA